jgi:adenylate kinase family enzyme
MVNNTTTSHIHRSGKMTTLKNLCKSLKVTQEDVAEFICFGVISDSTPRTIENALTIAECDVSIQQDLVEEFKVSFQELSRMIRESSLDLKKEF